MNCWSCRRQIPDDAEFCPHCEAQVEEEPTAEEQEAVANLLESFSPGILDEIQEIFEKSSSGEDFVNRVMVGDCPQCGGTKTGDCESDPQVDDPCIGRCFDCGQLWCLDCGELFDAATAADKHDCPTWEDFDDDLIDDDPSD